MAQKEGRVIYLKNDQIEFGILKDVGGRVVSFGLNGSENFLFSDSALWNEPESDRIIPTPESDFKAYNGFITWVGPQSQWWNQQTLNANRRNCIWPPDPFLEFGSFTIEEQTATSITLRGPKSWVSGIQLTKSFSMFENRLEITVTAQNISDKSVSWDLWSNLRFDAYTNFRVPINSGGLLKIDAVENEYKEPVAYRVEHGHFTFVPTPAISKMKVSKAFLQPSEGVIKIQFGSKVMNVRFELENREAIHPEQGHVEVYNCISVDEKSNLLELEHHSAYKTLKPGERMEMKEVWEVIANPLFQ
jgi:hypothetical protein